MVVQSRTSVKRMRNRFLVRVASLERIFSLKNVPYYDTMFPDGFPALFCKQFRGRRI